MESNKGLLISGLILIVVLLGVLILVPTPVNHQTDSSSQINQNQQPKNSNQQTNFMQITSPAFSSNAYIPSQYTCDGDSINPPLQFIAVPPNAQSLALIVEDPDAPSGTFYHWLVYNLSPTTLEIAENSVPSPASEGLSSTGKANYIGPCPPSGAHRYIFRLYALDIGPDLPPNLDINGLNQQIKDHIIEEASITGLYQRKK